MTPSQEYTKRRIEEARAFVGGYTNNPRMKAIRNALRRKSKKLNTTEEVVLQGWNSLTAIVLAPGPSGKGLCSNALLFAHALHYLPTREHVAIVKLIDLGYLAVGRGNDPESGAPMEVILWADDSPENALPEFLKANPSGLRHVDCPATATDPATREDDFRFASIAKLQIAFDRVDYLRTHSHTVKEADRGVCEIRRVMEEIGNLLVSKLPPTD